MLANDGRGNPLTMQYGRGTHGCCASLRVVCLSLFVRSPNRGAVAQGMDGIAAEGLMILLFFERL